MVNGNRVGLKFGGEVTLVRLALIKVKKLLHEEQKHIFYYIKIYKISYVYAHFTPRVFLYEF